MRFKARWTSEVRLGGSRRANPKLTVKWYIAHAEYIPALFDGLRKAGLPEDECWATRAALA